MEKHTPSESGLSIVTSNHERTVLEIVTRVAAAKGCHPFDLEPLSNVTDPDAIEMLLESSPEEFEVRFEYEGGRVTVSSGGVGFELRDEIS